MGWSMAAPLWTSLACGSLRAPPYGIRSPRRAAGNLRKRASIMAPHAPPGETRPRSRAHAPRGLPRTRPSGRRRPLDREPPRALEYRLLERDAPVRGALARARGAAHRGARGADRAARVQRLSELRPHRAVPRAR